MHLNGAVAIVHGDYRLDNAILDDHGHIIAVLDWASEETGGGDPTVPSNAVIGLAGFPTWEEAAARYAEKSGRDLSNLDFYIILAHFKLGVILENMHRRYLGGGTVGAGFETIGERALALGRSGLAIADSSSLPPTCSWRPLSDK